MTAKRKVYIGLFILGFGAFALIGWALYVESIGVRSPESGDTISELMRALWAHEPWIVLMASHLLAAPTWFFVGHWFGSPSAEYQRIRDEAAQRELA